MILHFLYVKYIFLLFSWYVLAISILYLGVIASGLLSVALIMMIAVMYWCTKLGDGCDVSARLRVGWWTRVSVDGWLDWVYKTQEPSFESKPISWGRMRARAGWIDYWSVHEWINKSDSFNSSIPFMWRIAIAFDGLLREHLLTRSTRISLCKSE